MIEQCEQASSREALAHHLRMEIDLPGALRWIDRRCQPISALLHTLKGLFPEQFAQCSPTLSDFRRVLQTSQVLMTLRERAERFLPQLPAPLGFAPRRTPGWAPRPRGQHLAGADPPALLA